MKTVMKQLLAYFVGIGLLGATLAHAQQRYVPNALSPSQLAPRYRDALRIAQQPMSAAQPTLPSPPQPVGSAIGNGTSPATGPHVPQSGTEGDFSAGFPGMTPNGQPANPMPPQMQGVETGLWDGCEGGTCCAECGGGYCQPPLWFTNQSVRFIGRSQPRLKALARVPEAIFGTTLITQKDIFNNRSANYDVAPGYYVTIGRYLGRDSQDRDDFLEFTYWGMNSWNDSAYVNNELLVPDPTAPQIGVGIMNSPFPKEVGGFNRATKESIDIHSEMHNFEWNLRLRPRGRPDQLVMQPNGRWKRECTPGAYMSYLAGIRFMTIDDGINWNASGEIVNTQTNQRFATSGNYNNRTENNLLGLQIGADLIFRRCKWSWGVHSKVGPYVNYARGVQNIRNQAAGDPFSFVALDNHFSATKQEVAIVGEVGFEANYKFTPNMTGRVAFDFMWISGLALAPEQFQFTATPVNFINMNGNIFSEGLTLGLEWSW
ncbi:MAG: BBP7 family outer membrane beta-barrel protein [Pirellulales bacterium]|nr:BBP7 family outer membrane beta-barrel protein [Pirellulales bacterium]